MGEVVVVKVMKRTRDRLAELGNKKETYEDVISKLIEFYEKNVSGRNEGMSRK